MGRGVKFDNLQGGGVQSGMACIGAALLQVALSQFAPMCIYSSFFPSLPGETQLPVWIDLTIG